MTDALDCNTSDTVQVYNGGAWLLWPAADLEPGMTYRECDADGQPLNAETFIFRDGM